MTLTIHWSLCDAPHTERIEGVTTVQTSEAGFYYGTSSVPFKRIWDIELADGWELSK